ncbi:host specificity J (Tail component) from phage origin domain protein [Escherichia coli 2-005-03_S4_C2]|nr:host specificity J (Tail component) from phage origin domain protein [Escherichia coli 2-005-03_S4_C2]
MRSVNLVGKSAFVEASGRASNDAAGYLELFREKIGKRIWQRRCGQRLTTVS